ncbi:MAG: hypothetical protein LIO96_07975 [Lachnospiraceae bacterium]|nr:hypothetical protein [Lachnospiraceae bacterium]
MSKVVSKKKYFKWLCDFIIDREHFEESSYHALLEFLYDTDFYYLIATDMDENRAMDGVELRYRFGYENSYNADEINVCLDDHPCSVLEMMIALADRCETHITHDPDIGDRTAFWFWNMILSLGLDYMNDENFDEDVANYILTRFLDREYDRDGKGGLFTIEDCKDDLRQVEIWCQMCWYLNTVL